MSAPTGAPASRGFSLPAVLRFVDVATDALAGAREEIDALNVYPVPDGDTGTNMFLTVSAARDAIREAVARDGDDLEAAMRALARGALLGARGNSGVILSQMLGAVAGRILRAGPDERTGHVLAEAIGEAADASYRAVGTPVEGTILTVSRAAADAAASYADHPDARARDVFTAAARGAREALARTPGQLAVLAEAGVVDAGGRGLCVVLDAAETVLTGRTPVVPPSVLGTRRIPVPVRDATHWDEGGPAYEVMYLLETDPGAVPALRERLLALGDSLVVVGDAALWNVHVHVDDVGAAIEAGIEAGRPYRIRVTHFAEQVAGRRARSAPAGRGIVAVAAGPGLHAVFAAAGAEVVDGGPGERPSTGMVLAAIRATGAAEVIVLPNDPDSVRVAEIAARTAESDHDLRVAVIPTQAQVQGLAALAVHEPGRTFDADVLEMTATARHVRHGAVTLAARAAMTMAGPCRPGDVLGVIDGDFAIVGDDLHTVATGVLGRLLGSGGELVTLVGGQDGGGLGDRCAAWLEAEHPLVDVVVYDGGQGRYPLLVSVE